MYFLVGIGILVVFLIFQNFRGGAGAGSEKIEQLKKENRDLIEKNAEFRAEISQKTEKIGELSQKLENEKNERSRLEGKGKEMFMRNTNLETENKNLRTERDRLLEKISKFEVDAVRREKEFLEKVEKLEHAREKLHAEQERVVREDEVARAKIEEARDRVWNEHENSALSMLREVCQKSEIGFRFFENTNLPENFDPKLKPDFLVDFLGQFLIFDAKKSRDPKNYFREQVKNTAKKYKNHPEIYPTVFFVFPRDEVAKLSNLSIFEDGILFFAISTDAIEPILRNFKKISEYENISEFDPADREKIVDFIAELENHISFQNATNLILTRKSLETFQKSKHLNSEIASEISIKKNEKNVKNFSISEIKKFLRNPEEQKNEIEALVSPVAEIPREDLDSAKRLFE